MEYVILKSKVKGHYATIAGKRVWISEHSRKGGVTKVLYHEKDSVERTLDALKKLLNFIKSLKERKQFTEKYRKEVEEKLKNLEKAAKYFKKQSQRQAVAKALKQIRMELEEKEMKGRIKSKSGTIILQDKIDGLKKLGYNIKDMSKLTINEINTIFYNDIEKE